MDTIDYRYAVVVDDTRDVGEVVRDWLIDSQYRVRLFSEPLKARDVLGSGEAAMVGVVLSDLQMPRMEGTEFLRNTAEILPGTVRVLMSAKDGVVPLMDGRIIHMVVRKPFEFQEFLRSVQQKVDELRVLHIQESVGL